MLLALDRIQSLLHLQTIHHPNLRQVICLSLDVEFCFIHVFVFRLSIIEFANWTNVEYSFPHNRFLIADSFNWSVEKFSNWPPSRKLLPRGAIVELQNLQNEVRKLSSLIGNSLRSNSTQSNSRKVLDYHRSFVQNLIGDCPKNTVKNVVDLNTALKDPKLAISMVIRNF